MNLEAVLPTVHSGKWPRIHWKAAIGFIRIPQRRVAVSLRQCLGGKNMVGTHTCILTTVFHLQPSKQKKKKKEEEKKKRKPVYLYGENTPGI